MLGELLPALATSDSDTAKCFERSTAFQKGRCEPIEQFRVGRFSSHVPELVGRIDDPPTEVVVPDAIHDRTPCEDVVRIGEPAGQRSSPCPFVGQVFQFKSTG